MWLVGVSAEAEVHRMHGLDRNQEGSARERWTYSSVALCEG
jgi:hypothetical protein